MMDMAQPSSKPLRGVNLGGWLVLEKWVTPSLFSGTDAADEHGFMQAAGAREKLERHRRTFIAETDFKWMAAHGLNAVRIPVGYWLLDGDGPYMPGVEYLDWAIQMAGKYDLRVLIDMHGAKGSQNGYDHSGRAGQAEWYQNRAYQEETIQVLTRLAQRYYRAPAVWGIELLNEPKFGLLQYRMLRRFYREAYRQLVETARPGTRIIFSDAFMPRLLSGILKEVPDYPVVMDIHWYQFGFTELQSYFAMLERRSQEVGRLQRRQPVIVGEWSGMLSRETLAGLSDEDKAAIQKRHIELQLSVYASTAGWFYWTYKTEEPGVWNFRSLVERGELHVS